MKHLYAVEAFTQCGELNQTGVWLVSTLIPFNSDLHQNTYRMIKHYQSNNDESVQIINLDNEDFKYEGYDDYKEYAEPESLHLHIKNGDATIYLGEIRTISQEEWNILEPYCSWMIDQSTNNQD